MYRFIETNGITLHALAFAGAEPTLVVLPGLTANAAFFGGVAAAGLSSQFQMLSLDLRGRGLSDKPDGGYTMADHAADVIGVLDAVGIERATLVGHSYGGLLSLYLAAKHADRVARIVVIDAGLASTEARVVAQIRPALDRLGVELPSVAAYTAAMKRMPFLDGYWDEAVAAYFTADMAVLADGRARAHATPAAINAVIDGVLAEDWAAIFQAAACPVLLINGTDPYVPGGAPILSAAEAAATVALLADCQYVRVPGNHITMLFGANARPVAAAIAAFVAPTP